MSQEALPFIRVIDFQQLKKLTEFPRYPQNADITVPVSVSDLGVTTSTSANSFNVFISHCWIAGYSGASEWRGYPHPDDKANRKFKLILEGVEKIWTSMCPDLKQCFVWLDYGCINQDGDPAGELKMLDKIIQWSDCIFTPVVYDDVQWNFTPTVEGLFKDYKVVEWNEGPYAYLNRGWCRIEMFYASNIPLANYSTKLASTRLGLKNAILADRRMHVLYGSRESFFNNAPYVLPPLLNTYFDEYNPINSNVTVESDRAKIIELVESLKPFMKQIVVGFSGDPCTENGLNGFGRYTYPSGDYFEGEFVGGKFGSSGKYVYTTGDFYVGQTNAGGLEGVGDFYYASGDVYHGEFHSNCMHGKGLFTYANGDVYDGDWDMRDRSGDAVMKYGNGAVYTGEFQLNVRMGQGRLVEPGGEFWFDGVWKDNAPVEGTGRVKLAALDAVYEGEVLYENQVPLAHGRGSLQKSDGTVISGTFDRNSVVESTTEQKPTSSTNKTSEQVPRAQVSSQTKESCCNVC